jgi:hypothetical protein
MRQGNLRGMLRWNGRLVVLEVSGLLGKYYLSVLFSFQEKKGFRVDLLDD